MPIVADMSSNICTRYNVEDFALIYAGAQKYRTSCVCDYVREDFLNDHYNCHNVGLPYSKLRQDRFTIHHHVSTSIFQKLVFDWVKNEIGGVDKMAEIQREKSGLLYDYIRSPDFYTNPVKDVRIYSCNIPFRHTK